MVWFKSMLWAWPLPLESVGRRSAAKMTMMAITTSISTSVKALRAEDRISRVWRNKFVLTVPIIPGEVDGRSSTWEQ
jgi:hypothetical protein